MDRNQIVDNNLDEATNQKLNNSVNDISKREVADDLKALGLAVLYVKYGQDVKAIETLNKLIASGNPSAELHFALGEIYENSSSNQLAIENYTKAMELALANRNYQVLVAAKAGLAKILDAQGNKGEGSRWRQEAQAELESWKNTARFEASADMEQRSKEEERLRRLINSEQQFMLLASGLCGECAGPGKWVFRKCAPC
jgi:tetratricopeptide (TPR) repeat protein